VTTLWFDCETRSECDLKAHGTHRYAEHQSTRIIVAQWAIDDGEPVVQDMTTERYYRPELAAALDDPTVTVVAHNSMFDRALLRHCWGLDVPTARWSDTMVKAMSHSLPGGLDKLSTIFGLGEDQAKDKRGKDLIRLFCLPKKDKQGALYFNDATSHPDEWQDFLEYSRQDIIAMRTIDKKLPKWNFEAGSSELVLWHLDQTINDRGFAVDLELANSAIEAVKEETARLKEEIHTATNGEVSSASKRDELLAYVLKEHGVTLPDMAADTLRRRLEDPNLPEAVKTLISIRLEATKTSTAKYKAVVNCASQDGRMRNTLQFAGALRTQRWAGRTFQPQNMPRPDMKQPEIDTGIAALKVGCASMVFPNVMQLTANTVRGCIVAPPGKKLVIADLSNIEGRGLAWLAGEDWKIKAFADFDQGRGHDLYKLAYARSFGVAPDTVDSSMRQIGKVQELGLGYEGGVAAFLTFAAVYRMDLTVLAKAVLATVDQTAYADALRVHEWAAKNDRTLGLPKDTYVACEILKAAWRAAHPATASFWKDVGATVRQAIDSPDTTFNCRQVATRRTGGWLRIRLPSGRQLCYLKPAVDDGQITYFGVNQYTRKWERLKTYGGKLVENIVQAWARDVLASSMQPVEDAGYKIVLTVHDEILTECPDDPAYTAEALGKMMATAPKWAEGCPLAAAGFETTRYRKG